MLIVVLSVIPQTSCRYNGKYRGSGSRLIEHVTTTNFSEANLPAESQLEFRKCHFPSFGPNLFQALDPAIKRVTFRKGSVRDVIVDWSVQLEGLQIIDTGLVELKAASDEPNYHLKQLTIRSKRFSEWSPTLASLTMLEEIDVAYCNLSYLNVQWFEGYERLKVLDVSKNSLSVFDVRQSSIPGLERLHLWGNRLEQLHRFPEAFPKLKKVTLAQNQWLCRWVGNVRGMILTQGVELMDMDGVCQVGWEINGGLCCKRGKHSEDLDSRRKSRSQTSVLIDREIVGMHGSVIGMKYGNTIVYVDEPLPIS
ncbi:hypothetical protein RP20_CCG009025 [Aedes albopictus]|nr:hypothetical protein RP20_CCG009025 [Aedes albopictus]